MGLAQELTERGFVYQFSGDSLERVLDGDTKQTVYLGIDPTADAIHVGNLVPYMLLNHFKKAGHVVLLVMGGGTALIGDPSGKDAEREFVDADVVAERCKKMERNIKNLGNNEQFVFLNNHDWLSKLSLIEFLRDVGKYFTVNAMVKKDSVSARLESEQGISFTEFSYALLQSYDFYHLHVEHGCTMQIGASDQWGNIVSGIDYIRRMTGDEVYGLTLPLVINEATGQKFGKSEGNAVWLDPEKTSPYTFYQFWFNISDTQVVPYLKLFTLLPLAEIEAIEKDHTSDPARRIGQKRLAHEVTAFVHGGHTAGLVKEASDILFGDKPLTNISATSKDMLLENAPVCDVDVDSLVVDVLVESGLASSKREARSLIGDGAVSINEDRIESVATKINGSVFVAGIALLRRGRKNVRVLRSL